MADLRELIREFQKIADHPRAVMERYLKEGKQIVGCFPSYAPEEIVHAAGMIPMGLWGGQITPMVAGKYNPIFTCSIMRSCLEYGMNGIYDGITCAIMPMLCDTFRGMSTAWRVGVPSIPLIAFIHPQNREDPGAGAFLAAEYETVRTRLEQTAGVTITEEALQQSLEVYNMHARTMQEFCKTANDHLDIITPVVRHAVMKSARFLDKSEHTGLVIQLIRELRKLPRHEWTGKKIILTGITAEPDNFLEMFTENNVAVVGDDLEQESRQYRTLIPEGATAMERLANQWLERIGCSMVHENRADRGTLLAHMAKQLDADGIAVCLMRFCDVEEYDFPYLSKDVEEAGYPCLCLEIDQSTQDNQQSRLKIQSFAEMA